MKSRNGLAGSLAFLLLAALTQSAPRPASASVGQAGATKLTEALRGLEKALTRHGSYASGGILRRFDAKDFRGCRITYELTPQVSPEHKGFVPFTERTTADLSSLDADRVEVSAGKKSVQVSFATRAGASGIERRLGEGPHSFGAAAELRSAYLRLTSREAAENVREALVRAIEVCAK